MKKIVVFVIITYINNVLGDKPCAARPITKESVVCVCNATYCDEITRENPKKKHFITYTSSREGLRFKKSFGTWKDYTSSNPRTLEINPTSRYQTIQGFGGAVTDSAGINWKSLSDSLQEKLINSYFSENGLQYNMLRVPIGGTDFSTHAYAYNELPENDTLLTNFTLAPEDLNYKIPMIKAIMKASPAAVHIVATTWSPPLWMKTHRTFAGYSRLKREYYQTYADYHLKFIQKYNESNIPIWAITTTNEPINGVFSLAGFNSLGWSMNEMGRWIENNLGPTIRNSDFRNVKIITGDDQRFTVPYWFNMMLVFHPKALEYVDGIGVHFYTDMIIPASVLEAVTKTHPDKFILGTEACEGSKPWQKEKVLLGSWERAKSYIRDILEDLNYNVVGWIDWNLCVDTKGGPNWASNYVDSPIIVNVTNGEFIKQPMFYAMGHFSKFIPRGSERIEVIEHKSIFTFSLHHVAFITPINTIVLVVYNNGDAKTIYVKIGKRHATLDLDAHSDPVGNRHVRLFLSHHEAVNENFTFPENDKYDYGEVLVPQIPNQLGLKFYLVLVVFLLSFYTLM